MAIVSSLYRYPVKGLSAQPLTQVALEAAKPFPFDRVFALARPGAPIDAANPQWAKKGLFVMLMLDEALARITTEIDSVTHRITVAKDGRQIAQANLDDAAGRAELEKLIWDLLPGLPAPPTLLASRGGHFMDKPDNVISLINRATVRSLEQRWGYTIDPLRFRANIYIDGVAPWEEFDWVGSDIAIGGITFSVDRKNGRCGATNVNPQTGTRDLNIPQALRTDFGHKDLGVYLIARNTGSVAAGDAVLPPQSSRTGTPVAAHGAASAASSSFMCRGCYYIYDESRGATAHGIAPGTAFASIPDDWCCPDCGTDKAAFRANGGPAT
jgi:GntR family transcriptional regulator/MocR family aminotransferase